MVEKSSSDLKNKPKEFKSNSKLKNKELNPEKNVFSKKLKYLLGIWTFLTIMVFIGIFFLTSDGEKSLISDEEKSFIDIDLCQDLLDEQEKDDCYYFYVSNGTLRVDYCSEIKSNEARGFCELTGINIFVEENNNSTSCLELGNEALQFLNSSYRDTCYGGFSVKLNDPSLCQEIINTQLRELCEIGQGEVTDCESLSSEELIDECYFDKSINQECLWNNFISGEPISECIFPEECSKIESSFSKDFCYSRAGSALKEIAICEKINAKNYKDSCMSIAVTSNGNIEECENFEKTNRDNCIHQIAVDSQNESICEQISDGFPRNSCYFQLFMNKREVTICEMMSESGPYDNWKKKCLAIYNKDETICEGNNSCISSVAYELKDISICELITEDYTKDSCIDIIENSITF